jgi:hypothetical protein
MSFLQKSLALSFRRKPESRIARKYRIPGRDSLARNDDFLLLPRVLQEAQIYAKFWILEAALKILGAKEKFTLAPRLKYPLLQNSLGYFGV